MKIALSQQNYILGHFEYNIQKIVRDIEWAISEEADLIVFSELSICGYPPTDFFYFKDFLNSCLDSINKLLSYSQKIGILVGLPIVNPKIEGKDIFNAAAYLYEGKVQQWIHKALLPTYDIFDEYRYFEPATQFKCIEHKGVKLAVTICEDIWNIGNENPMYDICPMDQLITEKPSAMINLSASPFNFSHADSRKEIVKANCLKYQLPMVYCNAVGAQTEIIFDGGSLVCDATGNPIKELEYFKEDRAIVDIYQIGSDKDIQPNWSKEARKHQAIISGIKDYFHKIGFKKAILGLSGGVDSALTLVMAAEALGAENVMSVLMPSQFSSNHSIDDSIQLCKNLGSPYQIIPIKDSFDAVLTSLQPAFEGKPFDVAEENLQARIRGMILMAISNKHGYILLNTSNKSEMAVGYGTLYGDMCGAISVLGDVYKTEVYKICDYINRNSEIIPNHILTKAPSAELRPNQKDQDSLPPYDILDTILYQYIEKERSPHEIIAKGFDEELVYKILKMVNRNEFKRFQAPPILRVSSKAFGFGRRMPLVGKYLEK